ncbi:MAG: LD-carboxypeptidase [Chitinophagales bacterium]|nr:LD-carboxypeptidase [Chitinophagaceae bacterium]MCB9065426.1 LD-carboxypeptidase [Chitinophagales bacterium]
MVKTNIEHPPYLKRGDTVGITCPAGYVSEDRIRFAIETLKLWGFNVKVGTTVGNEHHYFSGTDGERLNDLQNMLDDPSVKAILMGRGGYGTSRIVDNLDWTKFKLNPKWICGFSDITVLHSHLHATMQIPSLHGPMTGAFRPDTINSDHIQQCYAALTGGSLYYHTEPSKLNRLGSANGILVGGNLAILSHLVGSKSDIDTTEKILFIEDIGEHLYKVDRMLLTLKRAGKLSKLRGLVVGGFTEMEDTERPFGKTVEEIIRNAVEEYDYPVCFDFPVGHIEENHTLALGMWHKLNVTEQGGQLHLDHMSNA